MADLKNKIYRKLPDISAKTLHILAMFFMLSDHMWATIIPGQNWLTCVGRLAYPIFAFLAVEGYFHTHNFKKYMLRLLLFAVISEIPFNLMYGASVIYPYHQNVLWTFLIALGGIWGIEQVKQRVKKWFVIPLILLIVLVCAGLGTIGMTDYYGAGVLMVFLFYVFHGRAWWCFVGQVIAMYWVNVHLLGSMYYPITLFGKEFSFVQQGLALFALVPIWLYRGRQGGHSKIFQYFCYAFYPVHILILYLLTYIV